MLGAAAGIIGSLMAHEAIKLLVGIGEPLTDRLLVFDGLTSRWREVPLRRDLRCAVCGESPSIRQPIAIDEGPCVEAQQEGAWRKSR